MELPFGIDPKLGLEGLDYNRVEAIMNSVPKPHPSFIDYRVTLFPSSDNFNIVATSVDYSEKKAMLISIYEIKKSLQDRHDLEDKDPLNSELYASSDINPLFNYLLEPQWDGTIKLLMITLVSEFRGTVGWRINLTYVYRRGLAKTAE